MSTLLIIFQGPSASGKSTLQGKLGLEKLVTWTSREPRLHEIDGQDYFFVEKDYMVNMFNSGKMVEMTEYQGNYYGTSIDSIKETIKEKKPRSIILDANGSKVMKDLFFEEVLIVGVFAEREQCRQRLLNRDIDDGDLDLRMSTYDSEIEDLFQCDLIIRNTDENLLKAESIIKNIKEGLGGNDFL